MPPRRTLSNALVVLGAIAIVAILGYSLVTSSASGPPGLRATPSTAAPAAGSAGESAAPSLPPSEEPSEEVADTAEGIDSHVPVGLPKRVELYAGSVSVAPGDTLQLHVSTAAKSYTFAIDRLDATVRGGGVVVQRSSSRTGHDYRARSTFDTLNRTARANWPVTDTIATKGWLPGVYVVTAHDAAGTTGQAIFVVRTPVLQADRPAFVFTALTYEAYNLWGGADLYDYAGPRAVRVSFERPYDLDGGKGYWTRDDDRILRWLQLRRLPLQYTTDYDLAVNPPATAPRLLILPRHSEYVTASLREWVEQHVNVAGDMNVLSFGSNGFYWQVRLAEPRTPGAPMDIVCYKSAKNDPLAAADPEHATVRWRDAPLRRPEGAVFGAQYVKVLGDGFSRYDYTVAPEMPAALLAGTGWRTGTIIRGLLLGEGDVVFPGTGGIAIMDGHAVDAKGAPVTTSVTIRTSTAGARIFDAGTFAWADGFAPAKIDIGVPVASFDRFNRNVLAWLGFPTSS